MPKTTNKAGREELARRKASPVRGTKPGDPSDDKSVEAPVNRMMGPGRGRSQRK